MSEHLRLVLVLTAVEQAGGPVTIDEICHQLDGERADVEGLVAELERRRKLTREGERVRLSV